MDTPQANPTQNDAETAAPPMQIPANDPVTASPAVIPPPQPVPVPANVGGSSTLSQPIFNPGGSVQSVPSRARGITSELQLQVWKEGVTTLIGIAIIGFTLVLAAIIFRWIGVLDLTSNLDKERLSSAKDMLQIMLGLSGVVLGYYFGRIPADARAAQAQEQANTANAQAQDTSAQADAAADQLEQVMNNLPTEAVTRDLGRASSSSVNTDLKDIRDKLRNVAKSGRRR